MGSLHLHTGPQGSYYYFKNNIIDRISDNQMESFVAILPVNRAVRYLKKELVSVLRTKALPDPPIYTFASLAQRLYQYMPQRKKIILTPMRLVLVNSLLRSLQPDLNYFRSQWRLGNGLVQKVERMVEEFYQFGYRPEDFSEPPPTAEIKYNDFGYLIAQLFTLYSDRLIDEAALLAETVNLLDRDIFKRFSPDLKKIYISGFGIYSPPMLKFITRAKEYFDVEIKIEYNATNTHLFNHTSDAFDALAKLATTITNHTADTDDLYTSLFTPSLRRGTKPLSSTGLKIQGNQNREQEVRYIASKIKEIYHRNNGKLSRIGVTFPNIESYTPLIRKVFKEFNIPYNLSTGFPMAESPLIQSLIQVLRVPASGFASEEVYKLMLSPFLKSDMTVEAEFIRQYSKKFRLNFISDQWITRIQTYHSGIGRKYTDLNVFKEHSAEDTAQILATIQALIATIKSLSVKQPAEELRSVYIQVLKQLGMINWYDREDGFLDIAEKEKEFRAFNRFIKLLDQVVWILTYTRKKEKISVSDFCDNLLLIFENATYNLREWSEYGVQIMPRLEILSLIMDTLFVGGLIEGEFPRHFIHDIFFNDDERATMGLNASEDLLSQDRFMFYQLLTSGAKRIILSYPEYDGDTKLLSSTFLQNLEESVHDLKKVRQITQYQYPSAVTFLEFLGASLKKSVSNEDKNNYVSWQSLGNKTVAQFWQSAIETWYAKKNQKAVTVYEGNLTGSTMVEGILRDRVNQHAFSVTALESYAFCPMQYYLQRILHLDMEEDLEAAITSLERGNAIHKILYLFYSRLDLDQKKCPWNYKQLLEQTANEVFDTLPYNDIIWAVEREKYFGSTDQPGLWTAFLELEKTNIESTGFVPTMFETGFGYVSSDTSSRQNPPLVIKNKNLVIKIYGKLDRIDVDSKGKLTVIDYKTGQGSLRINLKRMIEGQNLQLPIYIAAAQQILERQRPVAGIYYLVQDGLNCRQKPVIVDQDVTDRIKGTKDSVLPFKPENNKAVSTFSELIQLSLDHATGYVQEIAGGNFRHTFNPRDERCVSYCGFSKICRKDVAKLEKMGEEDYHMSSHPTPGHD